MIAGGTGFIGKHLTACLLKRNDEISILSRDKKKIIDLYSNSVEAICWDELSAETLKKYDAIINLTGKNINEKRWNKQVKKEIVDSRVISTQTLAKLCGALGADSPRILNASAVGFYGSTGIYPQQPMPVDENWQMPVAGPLDFLSEIASQSENALIPAIKHGVKVNMMRFGVVLKINESMLGKLAIPAKLGLVGNLGSGQQWLSWIHLDDLLASIVFLLEHPAITGPINLAHPIPVRQSEFIHALAKHYHRPCLLNMPAWLVKLLFGEMGQTLLLSGQKVMPTKLLNNGFKFSKASINEAFI